MRSRINIKSLSRIPVVAAAGIIPLIVRVSVHTNDELSGTSWLSESYYRYADIFFAWKAYAVQILLAAIALILIYHVFYKKEKLPYKKVMVLLAAYLFFALISAVFSGNASLAFKGSFERFEPVGVLAGYILIFYYSYYSIRNEEDFRILVRILAVCTGLMIMLGILQSLGLDPFSLTLVKKMITPLSLHDKIDNLQMMREKGTAYLTLYNEDYLGMYFNLLIPVCVSLVFAAKSRAGKITAAVFALASLFVMYHGYSVGGWITLVLIGILTVMMLSERGKKGAVISWICLGLVILTIVIVLKFVPSVRDRVYRELSSSSGRVHKITEVETGDFEVVFYYFDGNELHCAFDLDDNDMLTANFRDKNGEELAYYDNGGTLVLDERFEYADARVYPWQIDDVKAAMFEIDEHQWPIVRGNGGTYYFFNNELNEVKSGKVANAGLFDDGFLSGRGGIWNRSLPLLKKHILLGTGANAFITEYPQEDFVSLNYLYGWGYTEYNVKAHSLYLGNMIENGILGTLFLIGFFVLYLVSGVRKYSRKRTAAAAGADSYVYYVKFGLFLACAAYMISGFINDSNVCTAPIFWAFLGASVSDVSEETVGCKDGIAKTY